MAEDDARDSGPHGGGTAVAVADRAPSSDGWSSEVARQIATDALDGRLDDAGRSATGHRVRVAQIVSGLPWLRGGEVAAAMQAALLHDVHVDTACTLDDLASAGCPAEVLAVLRLLTRDPTEPAEVHLGRVAGSRIATAVALADLADLVEPSRLAALVPEARSALLTDAMPAWLRLSRPFVLGV